MLSVHHYLTIISYHPLLSIPVSIHQQTIDSNDHSTIVNPTQI